MVDLIMLRNIGSLGGIFKIWSFGILNRAENFSEKCSRAAQYIYNSFAKFLIANLSAYNNCNYDLIYSIALF